MSLGTPHVFILRAAPAPHKQIPRFRVRNPHKSDTNQFNCQTRHKILRLSTIPGLRMNKHSFGSPQEKSTPPTKICRIVRFTANFPQLILAGFSCACLRNQFHLSVDHASGAGNRKLTICFEPQQSSKKIGNGTPGDITADRQADVVHPNPIARLRERGRDGHVAITRRRPRLTARMNLNLRSRKPERVVSMAAIDRQNRVGHSPLNNLVG